MKFARIGVPLLFFLFVFATLGMSSPSRVPETFVSQARLIPLESLAGIPVSERGRIQRLDAFARETVRLIAGTPTVWGLHPLQTYLALAVVPDSQSIEILELPHPKLRLALGLPRGRHRFSLAELERTPIEDASLRVPPRARAGLDRARIQVQALRQVVAGNHFTRALTFGTDATIQHGAHLLEQLAAVRLDQARSSAIAISRSVGVKKLLLQCGDF